MVVSIKDIAKLAGVSHSTVSRALRSDPLVAKDTAVRIRIIADDVGYVPSAVARSLKTKRTRVLGVIVNRISDPFYSKVLDGIESELQSEGYSLFLASSGNDPQREHAVIQAMVERRVDAIIICSTFVTEQHLEQLYRYGVPLVVVHNRATEDSMHSIRHDDRRGGREMTEHLISLGHKRIGFLGNIGAGRVTHERLTGYLEALEVAGIDAREEYIYYVANGDIESGVEGARYFLELPTLPTAIVCYNDLLALGTVQTLHKSGKKVPLDMSVAGFDNITLSEYVNPSLTTFDQPKFELGREAAHMVLRHLRMNDNQEPNATFDKLCLRGQMLVRQSTGPPPSWMNGS